MAGRDVDRINDQSVSQSVGRSLLSSTFARITISYQIGSCPISTSSPSIKQSSLGSDIPATQDIPVHNLSEPGMLVLLGCRDNGWWLGDVLAEDVALDEIGQPDACFVVEEFLCWDGENLWVDVSWSCIKHVGFGCLRSNSSSVSCLVSRTKQNIMPQAMRLSPA